MTAHPKNETSRKQYKGKWFRHRGRIENLTNISKSAANDSLGKIKGRKRRKH
jgi:hypothetical protein